jgi:phosphatidylethanolamine/phosphatidyl-N-methylethanolamine N-methyltransferase
MIAQAQKVGAIAPSGRRLARAFALQIEPTMAGPILEIGAGTGVIAEALLERGVSPNRLTAVEYDSALAAALTTQSPAFTVICGDAFELIDTLDPEDGLYFAGIVSGVPLLNFSLARRYAQVLL